MSGAYQSYQRLTPAEQAFVRSHPIDAMGFKEDADKALAAAQALYPAATLHNGQGDAFRHCYWNALMTRRTSAARAKEFADAHETNPGQPEAEMRMDLNNNEVGRNLAVANPGASDQKLTEVCQEALRTGKLITLF
jgi:hypothetical protein